MQPPPPRAHTPGAPSYPYICFPPGDYHLLGGIGQAKPEVPGGGPGAVFYLQVDDLGATLQAIQDNGGSTVMEPTTIDGFNFAMFKDSEDNIVGIIEPFGAPELPDDA